MAVGAIGEVGSIGSHLQIQGAGQTQPQAPGGVKVDGDGDYDNSTPSKDAAEGKGSRVNLTA